MILLLALQSLGTRDVCRSHTELGMDLKVVKELCEKRKHCWKDFPGLDMPHTNDVMKQSQMYLT